MRSKTLTRDEQSEWGMRYLAASTPVERAMVWLDFWESQPVSARRCQSGVLKPIVDLGCQVCSKRIAVAAIGDDGELTIEAGPLRLISTKTNHRMNASIRREGGKVWIEHRCKEKKHGRWRKVNRTHDLREDTIRALVTNAFQKKQTFRTLS